jgi:hypothetical protein
MYLSIYPSICWFVYLSIYLFIYPSIHPSIHFFVYPSIHLSIYLPIYVYPFCLFISLSVFLSFHTSFDDFIYLSIHLPIFQQIHPSIHHFFLFSAPFGPQKVSKSRLGCWTVFILASLQMCWLFLGLGSLQRGEGWGHWGVLGSLEG